MILVLTCSRPCMQISIWYFRRSRFKIKIFGACPRERVRVYTHFVWRQEVACIFFSGGGWWMSRVKQLAARTIPSVPADTPPIFRCIPPVSPWLEERGKQCKARCPTPSHSHPGNKQFSANAPPVGCLLFSCMQHLPCRHHA